MTSPARLHTSRPDDSAGTMGFLEHLDELRSRIIRCLIAVAAGMIVAAMFAERLTAFVMAPTLRAVGGASLLTTKPGEGFAFYFDVLLIGGVILSAPLVGYQVWRFIAPGLYAHERRLVLPFVLMGARTLAARASPPHGVGAVWL